MISSLNSVDLISSQNLHEILKREDIVDSSLKNRIISAITYPFYWIANCIENLAWRIIDPNWQFFVAKGKGHFTKSQHSEKFNESLEKVDKIFNDHIAASNEPKAWQAVHTAHSADLQSDKMKKLTWLIFSARFGGTCFGNCVSLSFAAMKMGRLLTIEEFKKIEGDEIFISTAQTVQLIENFAIQYNDEINQGVLEAISEEMKLAQLGLTEEKYKGLQGLDKERTDKLLNEGAILGDLEGMTLDQALKLEYMDFTGLLLRLTNTIRKRHQLNPGLSIIQEIGLLPLKNENKVNHIAVSNFHKAIYEKLASSHLKEGIMLIGAKRKIDGHAMMLQVDKQNNSYILYDNNRGYYQWHNLQSCLSGIETRLRNSDYETCEILLNSISA